MCFSEEEKRILLNTPFVGPKVIQRLEEIGINNLEKLSSLSQEYINNRVALLLNRTCWKNSPQAQKSILNAIEVAKNYLSSR